MTVWSLESGCWVNRENHGPETSGQILSETLLGNNSLPSVERTV